MLGSVFVASVLDLDSPQFYVATVAVAASWALNLEVELAKLRLPVKQDLTLINSLDLFHLVLVPLLTGLRLGESLMLVDLTGAMASAVAFGVGVLQVYLLWLYLRSTHHGSTYYGEPHLGRLPLLTLRCCLQVTLALRLLAYVSLF
jgi:hypothetical protein